MSVEQHREVCQRYKGRAVEIRLHNGVVHRGIIREVGRHKVYLQPLDRRQPQLGGFGYGFYGPGWGYAWGLGIGIALGAIATIALLPFFFF